MASPPGDHPDQDKPNDADSSAFNSLSYFQVPHPDPPQLPPEAYNYLAHALLSLQGSASHGYHPPTHPFPAPSGPYPNYNYPWPHTAIPPASTGPVAGPSSFYPTNPPQAASPLQYTTSPTASTATASPAQDPEDATSSADDKRRRNTAASARFRTKKKLKTLNLERTVADLTGRTEELEREATDLRRENMWLKEIVLLKGRSIAALDLGSQASGSGSRRDKDERDDRAHTESEPESTVKRKDKGKDKES